MHCSLPLREFQVKPNGDVYPCCEDWLPTKIGNVLEQTPDEIWQSTIAREIRASVAGGDFRHCTRCPYLPGPRGPVTTSPITEASPRPHTLRIDYLRGCNLACGSCRRHPERTTLDDVADVHLQILRSGLLKSVKRVCASGAGDPIADPSCWITLCNLHRLAPDNHDLEISLYTNGQLLDEQAWSDLGPNRAKLRDVGISVDAATESTYAELRGGSWPRLWRNIQLAKLVSSKERPFEVGLYFVLQARNFRELPQLAAMAHDLHLDWVEVFYLRNWGTYTREEYLQRAVHLPDHRDHHELTRVLQLLAKDTIVTLPTFPPRIT